LKALHIISEEPPVRSGFARCIDRLSRELANFGFEVDVLSVKRIKHWRVGEIKLCYDFGKIYTSRFDEYDIINIHGHTPTFSDNFLFSAKLRGCGKPIVYTLHCLVNFYLSPFSKFYNWVMNNLLGLADRVVVTSPSYKRFLRCREKVKVIPWGVDYEFFHAKRQNSDGYNVLFVGQMRPYKGLSLLLKAVKGLDLNLHVVGDGPDFPRYFELARKLNLSNVRFYGNIDDFKLRGLYSSCDVLVVPSVSMNEAFGLVTLEAAAAGCAVIASSLPGLSDVVRNFGVLVPPRDLGSLRDALIMLSDEDVRLKYVKRGFVESLKYRWRDVGERYAELYREVLSGS